MALGDVIIAQINDSGQTTVNVRFLTRLGHEGHVVVDRDKLDDAVLYPILRAQAANIDAKAAALATAQVTQLED